MHNLLLDLGSLTLDGDENLFFESEELISAKFSFNNSVIGELIPNRFLQWD